MSESKIQANTITNFDGTGAPDFPNGFGSGTVFPAGHVIQQEFVSFGTYTSRTSSTFTAASGFSKSITVLKSDSYILIYLFLAGAGTRDANGAGLGVKITESITSLDSLLDGLIGYNGVAQHNVTPASYCFKHIHSQSAGTTLNYEPKFNSSGNSSTSYFNRSGAAIPSYSSMLIQEISS